MRDPMDLLSTNMYRMVSIVLEKNYDNNRGSNVLDLRW